MIVYLDTSSLVKLYVEEEGSEAVRQEIEEAEVVATSSVAYPEARSGFARQRREEWLDEEEYDVVKEALEKDWPYYLVLAVTDGVLRRAGELAELYALRAYDAVHLASCLALASRNRRKTVRFSSFDRRLNEAAERALASTSA